MPLGLAVACLCLSLVVDFGIFLMCVAISRSHSCHCSVVRAPLVHPPCISPTKHRLKRRRIPRSSPSRARFPGAMRRPPRRSKARPRTPSTAWTSTTTAIMMTAAIPLAAAAAREAMPASRAKGLKGREMEGGKYRRGANARTFIHWMKGILRPWRNYRCRHRRRREGFRRLRRRHLRPRGKGKPQRGAVRGRCY